MSPKATTDESSTGDRKARFNSSQAAVRSQVARAVRLIFAILATILAVGAILVVLRGSINMTNPIVKFIIDTAEAISGPFSRTDGIFRFTGKSGISKNALLNWGLAAIVYLLIGRLLANLIAPKGRK